MSPVTLYKLRSLNFDCRNLKTCDHAHDRYTAPVKSCSVKSPFSRLALSAALLLGLLPARAQSLYGYKELFPQGAGTPGTRSVAGLNNRGEIFYMVGSQPPGSSIPGLWLPNSNYGLPAGLNDLTHFQSLSRGSLPGFTDGGTFFMTHAPAVPGEGSTIYQGSASGESKLCNQVVNQQVAGRTDPVGNPVYRQREFVVDGQTSLGQPFGHVLVQVQTVAPDGSLSGWKTSLAAEDALLGGLFVGLPPTAQVTALPGWENAPCAGGGVIPSFLASSPNGTTIIRNGWQCLADNLAFTELAVVGLGYARTISDTGSSQAPDPDPFSPLLTVNDAGDAAGVDGKGLWLSPHDGGVYRPGLTNTSSLLLDPAGSVWFVSNFYQDIWNWSPAGIYQLHLPWPSWGYTAVPTLRFVNARGELVVEAQKGTSNQRYAVLLSPSLKVALTVSTNHLSVGDHLTVTATMTALGDGPLTGVSPTGPLVWNGRGALQLLSGPSPAPPWTLPPGGHIQAEWQCQATTNGSGRFGLALQAPPLVSLPASSELVRIVPKGDLLMKRGVEPETLYAGLDVFQTVPAPPQVKTNAVGINSSSVFQVEIQNNDEQSRTFTFLANPSPKSGWDRSYLLDHQDVTARLEAPGGMTLPEIPPGSALTLVVTMVPTNGIAGDVVRVDFTLGLNSDPTLTLDAVEAVSRLAMEIVVNSTGDVPNEDPSGCCCDTGRKLADGTPECTLRAAIQVANSQPGKDIITFEIPSDDPNFSGGMALISPRRALPEITDPVVIVGWSQAPNSKTPPIELTGQKIERPSPPPETDMRFGNDLMNWEGADSGLVLRAGDCEVSGLIINSFPLCGMGIAGDHCVIHGNFIGTDRSGTEPLANGF